ncbi:hypothetical protein CSUB01_08215 [Colletotrichum sublineola]|uniref:Uncharacterized protein n=1 Tax=Colletotrichum sublineola TaxID=1173701 RepID=A0A066WWG1_COLSU|nr:hypothetical protein CSUB01_08215 [Colletotrichum sublineola]
MSNRERKEEVERETENLHGILSFLYLRPEPESVKMFKRLRMSDDASDYIAPENSLGISVWPWAKLADGAVVSDPVVFGFFQWNEPMLVGVVNQEESFLEGMRKGPPEAARYCSPLLVNAILAWDGFIRKPTNFAS